MPEPSFLQYGFSPTFLLLALLAAVAAGVPATGQQFKEAPKFYNSLNCPAIDTELDEAGTADSGGLPRICSAKAVHVAMTLDLAYLRGSMAVIHSVLQHSSCPENIHFHFIASASADTSLLRRTLSTSFPYLRFEIYSLDEGPVLGLISTSIREALDCPLNYARNYLANLLPRCIHCIVYFDFALVLMDDILNLAVTPFRDSAILAALEYYNANFTSYFTPTFWANSTLSLTFEGRKACYFNTGVMVIDLGKWCKWDYTMKIMEWMELQKRMRIYELGTLPPFLLVFVGNIAPVKGRREGSEGSCRGRRKGKREEAEEVAVKEVRICPIK